MAVLNCCVQQGGKVQGQRASVPAFGEWDEMKAAGVTLDYSLDFTKIRAARMQRKSQLPTVWSSAGSAPEVAGGGGSDADERNHHKPQSEHGDDDRRHRHHRRQYSDHTDLRRPLRPDRASEAPKVHT